VTDDGQCAQARRELGVYLLGAIEPAQRTLVDHHLAACRACRAELSGLAGLPSLLRRVPADAVWPLRADETVQATPQPPLSALSDRMAAFRRRRWVLTVAAAVITGIAAASGVQALHAATPRPPAAATAWARAVTVQAANPVTGTWAAVRYTAQPWGTALEVRITGVAAGTRCQLLVTGSGGQKVAAGGWYFTAGQHATWYPASVPLQAPSVRSFEITSGGKILVTIRAR
jgi:anti-sigma factor RsiW